MSVPRRRRIVGAALVGVVAFLGGSVTAVLTWGALGVPAFPVTGLAGWALLASALLGALGSTLIVGKPMADDYIADRVQEVRV